MTTTAMDAVSSVNFAASGTPIQDLYPQVTSSAAATTRVQAPTILWEVVLGSAAVSGVTTNVRTKDVVVTGTLVINGAIVGSASYQVAGISTAEILDGIKFIQQYWDGWSFNLNTKAPSFYENFKFNSFARIGKDYYGCNDTGIYLLGGDLDDTANIDAVITTNTSDLSTETYDGARMKIVPNVYIAARSPEPMLLTCNVEGKSCTYKFRAGKKVIASTRADVNKGLEGTFWQFELKNQNGSDFEILSLTAMPVAKSRKF